MLTSLCLFFNNNNVNELVIRPTFTQRDINDIHKNIVHALLNESINTVKKRMLALIVSFGGMTPLTMLRGIQLILSTNG